jgi:hypothetical protein
MKITLSRLLAVGLSLSASALLIGQGPAAIVFEGALRSGTPSCYIPQPRC